MRSWQIMQIAQGLACLHSHEIVHGNLCPVRRRVRALFATNSTPRPTSLWQMTRTSCWRMQEYISKLWNWCFRPMVTSPFPNRSYTSLIKSLMEKKCQQRVLMFSHLRAPAMLWVNDFKCWGLPWPGVTDYYRPGTIFWNCQPISTHFEDCPGWAHDAP